MYDYLIVGSGLFGSVFAHEMRNRGKRCLVIEKRNHIGGNVFCDEIEGIRIHRYGAHIFHTNDVRIWKYISRFVSFNNYINSPLANYHGKLYHLPFNMHTFRQLWGVTTPEEAQLVIAEQIASYPHNGMENLESYALKTVGPEVYEKFIKHYTEKQWGRKAVDLPASIIKRIPVRFTYDNNYFNDKYQGIPIGGYNTLIEKLLAGIDVKTSVSYFDDRRYFEQIAKKTIYTGRIDEFFDFRWGELEYRGLRFETEILPIPDFQVNAVINFTDAVTPYTRTYEHKHFEFGKQQHTVITREYPLPVTRHTEPYYPVNDKPNMTRLNLYNQLAKEQKQVVFGGRLASYRYYNMDQVIAAALKCSANETCE